MVHTITYALKFTIPKCVATSSPIRARSGNFGQAGRFLKKRGEGWRPGEITPFALPAPAAACIFDLLVAARGWGLAGRWSLGR